MYSFVIDDASNIMESRGTTREKVDALLAGGLLEVTEDDFDKKVEDSNAEKDAMFGGASF